MRLFGRDIRLQWPVKAARANYPLPADHGAASVGGPVGGGGDSDLWERNITSDPRELWFLSLPHKLTPQQTLNILRAALGGDLWQQWMLLSLMLDTWPTFRMAQHQLREAVAYTRFQFDPYLEEEGAEATPSAVNKARLAARAFRSMSPDPFTDEKGGSGTVYDFTDAALNGISMNELMWGKELVDGVDGPERLPRASAWTHPRHYTFTREGKLAVFQEHFAYHQESFMQLSGNKPGRLPEAPDPRKYVCSQFISRSGSSLGAGFMRPLAYYWSIRQFGWEFMAQASKKHGSPFIDITYRPGASDVTERARIKKFCQEAGPDRFLIHPEGTVATIHPAQSLGPDNPTRFTIEQADRECLFLLLGQANTTMASPGKLGDEGTHADVKDERVQGLADWAARNPMRQFARAVLSVNYGDDSECPTVQADFTKPLDSAQVAQLASAITMSRMAFQRDEVYKKLNMTPPQPGDVVVEGGQTVIMEEPVTRSEMQELQMKAQVYDQLAAQQQGGGGDPESQEEVEAHYVQAAKALGGRAGRKGGGPRTMAGLKALLAGCGRDDLDDLERLVEAAQKAGEGNGEWRAVEVKVNELSSNRLKGIT